MKRFKKYKKELALEKMAHKYKFVYFLSYSVGFIILAIVVGVSLFIILSRSFYKSSKISIEGYLSQFIDNGNSKPPNSTTKYPKIASTKLSAVIFYVDSDDNVVEKHIIGADFNEDYYKAIDEDFSIDREEDIYIITILNEDFYLTKLIEITNEAYMKADLTGYVKVYNNVVAEYMLRSKIVSIYIMISIIAFAVSLGLGLIIMKQGSKPLNLFIKKQTNFVSDASHELRTPLAVVQSKIETILSQPEKKVYDISEELAVALNEVNRLTKLTKELLTLAHNDKDNIDINYSVFDCHEALKEIIEPFIEIATLEKKKLNYEGVNCLVKLDKDKLKQIMIINIDNALKYTEENDEINISLKTNKDEVIIVIADTGIGMSGEAKEKAFERFYRADKARSRESGGNGLGLSIAETLINLQKGNIKILDNEPKGTKFVISFPKAKEKDIVQSHSNDNN